MRTTILLFFILSFSFLVYSQQLQTIKVSPYSKVILPQEPIVYFPATSLSLGKGGITVKRNNAGGEVVNEPEVIIDTTMVYKPKKSDLGSSEGRGYPFSCAAELTFTKPGQTYYVKISADPGCGKCNDPRTVPMGIWIGNDEFLVEVDYPSLAIKLKPNELSYVVGVNSVATRSFYFKGLPEDELYEYEITATNKDNNTVENTVSGKGSEVDFSEFLDFQYENTTNVVKIKYGMGDKKELITFKNESDLTNPDLVQTAEFPFYISYPKELEFTFGDWCPDCPLADLPVINTKGISKNNKEIKIKYKQSGINFAPNLYDKEISFGGDKRILSLKEKRDGTSLVFPVSFNDSFNNEVIQVVFRYKMSENSPWETRVFKAKLITN